MGPREEIIHKQVPFNGYPEYICIKFPADLRDKIQYKNLKNWYYRDIDLYEYQTLIINSRTLFVYEY
jgi:hypothetical protein